MAAFASKAGYARRFALNGEPDQKLALQGREAGKLLGEHQADIVEDETFAHERFIAQEGRHVPVENLLDGARHQFQGQRVA